MELSGRGVHAARTRVGSWLRATYELSRSWFIMHCVLQWLSAIAKNKIDLPGIETRELAWQKVKIICSPASERGYKALKIASKRVVIMFKQSFKRLTNHEVTAFQNTSQTISIDEKYLHSLLKSLFKASWKLLESFFFFRIISKASSNILKVSASVPARFPQFYSQNFSKLCWKLPRASKKFLSKLLRAHLVVKAWVKAFKSYFKENLHLLRLIFLCSFYSFQKLTYHLISPFRADFPEESLKS